MPRKTSNTVKMEYLVPVKMVFRGTVTIDALNKMEAREIVDRNFRATLGTITNNQCEDIRDWEMDMHTSEVMYERITLK